MSRPRPHDSPPPPVLGEGAPAAPSGEWLEAADGSRLHLVRWAPGAERAQESGVPARGAGVVIAHGFGEHLGRHRQVAARLVTAGYTVLALDHRGHGRSTGPRGHVERFARYLDDLDLAVRAAPAPRYLLGHSFGGLVALRYAERSPDLLAGLCLSSPLLGLARPAPAHKRLMGRLLSRLWPGFTLSHGLDPAGLSRDPAVVAAYRDDPLVHDRASARFYTELLSAMRRARAHAPRLRLPTLVLQAGDDRIVSVAATRATFAALGSPDKHLILYPGLFHEIFNEPERERPLRDLLDWLNRRTAPREPEPKAR